MPVLSYNVPQKNDFFVPACCCCLLACLLLLLAVVAKIRHSPWTLKRGVKPPLGNQVGKKCCYLLVMLLRLAAEPCCCG